MKPQPPPASSDYVHPHRLIEAADAILHAQGKSGGGTVTRKTDPRYVGAGFSSTELIEAYMFLARLGLVEGRD